MLVMMQPIRTACSATGANTPTRASRRRGCARQMGRWYAVGGSTLLGGIGSNLRNARSRGTLLVYIFKYDVKKKKKKKIKIVHKCWP